MHMHNKILEEALQYKFGSKDDVMNLIVKYKKEKNQQKKEELQNLILSHNIRFIKKLSHKFGSLYYDSNDAFQQGCLGFFDALRTFDPSRKTAFSTYLYYWVCKYIFDGNQKYIVNVPRNIQYLMQVLAKYRTICESDDQENNKEFLKNKLLKDKDIREKYIDNPRQKTDIQVVNLEDSISIWNGGGNDLRYIDIIRDDSKNPENDAVKKVTQEEIITIIKDKLNDNERKVIMLRFFQDEDTVTYKQIGDKMNKSTERIRQIEHNAIEKLRRVMHRKYASNFPLMGV